MSWPARAGGRSEPEPVRYHHLSVIREGAEREADGEAVAAPVAEDLTERYLWYLDVGGPALAEALVLLGEADSYPLVFHCAAGKDRTGVLAALVLDIVGVDAADIVADYLITESRMDADPRSVPVGPGLRGPDGHAAGRPVRRGGRHHGALPRGRGRPVRGQRGLGPRRRGAARFHRAHARPPSRAGRQSGLNVRVLSGRPGPGATP